MKLVKVAKAYINPKSTKGNYSATDAETGRIYKPVYFSFPSDDIVIQPHIGQVCLLMEMSGGYYCLGYFTRSQHLYKNQIILVDGETLFKAGESRGVIISPTGTVGIYSIRRKADGSLTRIPKIEYNENDELLLEFSSVVASMFGAASHGNIALEKMEAGGYRYKFAGKTNQSDGSPRFSFEIIQGTTGPMFDIKVDNVPSAINPAPLPGSFSPLTTTHLKIGSQGTSPASKMLDMVINNLFNLNVTRDGTLSVDINNLANLKMDTTGQVIVRSGVGNQIVFRMSPDGKFEIGTSGAKLMQIIIAFLGIFINHTHMTGAGVSSVPISPDISAATAEKSKSQHLAGSITGT